MRPRQIALVLSVALVGCLCPTIAHGQVNAHPSAVEAELFPDSIALGDPFALRFSVPVPKGSVAYFPDSLLTTGAYAPFGPVEWTTTPAPDGGVVLSVSYPLLALEVGDVDIPDFEFLLAERVSNATEVVGSWSRVESISSARPVSVPGLRLWVNSVLPPEDIAQGLVPRPAADVWGENWSWPTLLLITVSAGALIVVITAGARDLLGGSVKSVSHDVEPSAHTVALEALDRLLAAGLHSDGRVEEFYRQSSDIVRRYVETLDSSWGAAHTSTELMKALDTQRKELTGAQLLAEMGSAETVKFGRERPADSIAETHWHSLRDWVAHSGPSEP